MPPKSHTHFVAAVLLLAGGMASVAGAQNKPAPALNPAKMAKLGTVDPRYVSYNIEMVEITGGRFWKPYASATQPAPTPSSAPDVNQPAGLSASLYQYRPPIDLANPRLRKLAAALGPAYIRVSGTWQNSTYFQDDDNPALKDPPQGFRSVLTRAEWKGVLDFAKAVDGKIVTSFAISAGTRDASGLWTPAQAKAFLAYTRTAGGNITAAEFMNEPTFPGPGGAPAGYDAAAFAKDARAFGSFLRAQSPKTVFLGPGSVGEGVSMMPGGMPVQMKLLATEDLMKQTGPIFDAFSYHFYGSVSRRCMGNITPAQALTAEWLDRTDGAEAFYAAQRDKYLPGKPTWLTETAEAACGGDPFAGQFVDTFRFVNQLGTLAQKGVQVVMHNTLAASDYGLLNEETLEPRPNYWAALLWNRLMSPVVLDPGVAKSDAVRIYAHCAKDGKGGVAMVALNTSPQEQMIAIAQPGEVYTLSAPDLASTSVSLNGGELHAAADGTAPMPAGDPVKAGNFHLLPDSVSFLLIPGARNKACM